MLWQAVCQCTSPLRLLWAAQAPPAMTVTCLIYPSPSLVSLAHNVGSQSPLAPCSQVHLPATCLLGSTCQPGSLTPSSKATPLASHDPVLKPGRTGFQGKKVLSSYPNSAALAPNTVQIDPRTSCNALGRANHALQSLSKLLIHLE
jgi:hypothetical protein